MSDSGEPPYQSHQHLPNLRRREVPAEAVSAARVTQGLCRRERVRRRPDFEHAYDEGSRVHGRFMTVFVVSNGRSTSRFGVAATRKLGPAVERNRAKRLARELFRRRKVAGGVDVIIVPRREMLDAPFASLQTDFDATLARRGRPSPARRPRRAGSAARV